MHRPPMLLLDKVVSADHQTAAAEITICETSSFFEETNGVPSHIGMEYMAQTLGLVAGTIARERGDGAPLGYLLGTRKYVCNTRWFPPNCTLLVKASEELSDENLGVFDCSIESTNLAENIHASARLTVYKAGE